MIVVFDLDGTVIDSSRSLLEAHEVAFASMGRKRPSENEILELVGLPLLQTMRRLAPDLDAAALASAYSEAYAPAALKYEQLFEGMSELFEQPFRAAVATGKSQHGAERAVQRHGLSERFELVLGADSVDRPKPYPDLLNAIRDMTGVDALVMVGDTTYDLQMAHAAHASAIGVSWGHHNVKRLKEWAPVVDSVSALGIALGVYS